VESRFGPFGNGVSVGAIYWGTVCAERTQAQKSFWTHLMVLLGDEAQVEARLCSFGDSANLDGR
jgi:hypothetical protein